MKKGRKGLFRRIIDAIKRLFGIGKTDEESALQAYTSGREDAAPTDEELDSIYKDVGIDMSRVEELGRKSGSSPIVTVPSSEDARLDRPKESSSLEETEEKTK